MKQLLNISRSANSFFIEFDFNEGSIETVTFRSPEFCEIDKVITENCSVTITATNGTNFNSATPTKFTLTKTNVYTLTITRLVSGFSSVKLESFGLPEKSNLYSFYGVNDYEGNRDKIYAMLSVSGFNTYDYIREYYDLTDTTLYNDYPVPNRIINANYIQWRGMNYVNVSGEERIYLNGQNGSSNNRFSLIYFVISSGARQYKFYNVDDTEIVDISRSSNDFYDDSLAFTSLNNFTDAQYNKAYDEFVLGNNSYGIYRMPRTSVLGNTLANLKSEAFQTFPDNGSTFHDIPSSNGRLYAIGHPRVLINSDNKIEKLQSLVGISGFYGDYKRSTQEYLVGTNGGLLTYSLTTGIEFVGQLYYGAPYLRGGGHISADGNNMIIYGSAVSYSSADNQKFALFDLSSGSPVHLGTYDMNPSHLSALKWIQATKLGTKAANDKSYVIDYDFNTLANNRIQVLNIKGTDANAHEGFINVGAQIHKIITNGNPI